MSQFARVFLCIASVTLLSLRASLGTVQAAPTEADIQNYIKSRNFEARRGEVEANIASWGTGAQKWEHFQGAEFPQMLEAILDDFKKGIEDFRSCQPDSYKHDPMTFLLNAFVPAKGKLVTPLGTFTAIIYTNLWETSGFCIKWTLRCCFSIKVDAATLVPYHYAVETIDASEQAYQSPYHLKPFVKLYMVLNKLTEDLLATFNVRSSIAMVRAKQAMGAFDLAGIAGALGGIDTGPAERAWDAVKSLRDKHPDFTHTAPNLTLGFARAFMTLLEVMTPSMRGIPHNTRLPYSGTDMPFWYAYSRFPVFALSKASGEARGAFLAPYGERLCVRQNIRTGKTPDLPLVLKGPPLGNENALAKQMCIKNVGEVFPLSAGRRPHITDGSLQSVIKYLEIIGAAGSGNSRSNGVGGAEMKDAMKGLQKEVGGAVTKELEGVMGGSFGKIAKSINLSAMSDARYYGNHTFRRDLDRFRVIRNDTFRGENDRCAPIDELAKVNMSYDRSNSKVARSGGLQAFAGWRLFQGCWGYKGKNKSWWKGGLPGSGIYSWPGASSPLGSDTRLE